MSDIIINGGVQGAVGDNVTGTVNMGVHDNINYANLESELQKLLAHMEGKQKNNEQQKDYDSIREAKEAATAKNKSRLLKAIHAIGKWGYDISKEIDADLLLHLMGIK